jgi:flagellar basal-body rod protein FlgF
MGAIEIATSILSRSEQRVEIAAQNLANMTTPGYKSRQPFADLITGAWDSPTVSAPGSGQDKPQVNFTDGKLQQTGNPYDLAISGSGFFAVRSGDAVYYTRNGQFSRDSDGHLVTAGGMALQSDGGDVTLGTNSKTGANNTTGASNNSVTILADGTILEGGQPVSKLTLADFADTKTLQPAGDGVFSAPAGAARGVDNPQIHQGMLEASNVSTADEMISMMAALRSAGTGQHVVQVYDDLMGRALTAFGES